MILVTGGTGLVGSHLLYHLLNEGIEVKAIHRKNSELDKVLSIFSFYTLEAEKLFQKIEWIEADLNDLPALELAFEGISFVYHCAALISFDPRDFDRLQQINKVGTENIVNLCLAKKVKKLCYVSSIASISNNKSKKMATEHDEWNESRPNVYALSKYLAEIEVWRGSQEGLDMVIVNPGVILGPGHWNSGSGFMFKTAAKGPPFYPPGGTGFVTVNDLVKIMIKLMQSQISKERFIVIDQNLTFKEILSNIAREFGKPTPKQRLKLWQLQILWRLDWLRCLITGGKRIMTKDGVASLKSRTLYSNEKVKNALNFEFELLPEAIYFICNRFKEENPRLF